MFSTLKLRLLLGLYIFLVISIPVGAYLASQYQNIKSRASEQSSKPVVKTTPKPTTSAAKDLLSSSESNIKDLESELDASPSPESSSPTVATSFGPTLSLAITLEGRPDSDQSTKLFVGIVEGSLSSNPKFLLSFTVDVPKAGSYSGLSLAGLSAGSTYTALVKGEAQIASSASFTMSPAVTNLNQGQALTMLTGDLNDDNIINSADYSIVQKAFGASSTSSNWNSLADFNKDGIINAFDLSIVSKNLGKIGDSGAWTSPIPTATPSARLNTTPSQGGLPAGSQGYWIWIPKSP